MFVCRFVCLTVCLSAQIAPFPRCLIFCDAQSTKNETEKLWRLTSEEHPHQNQNEEGSGDKDWTVRSPICRLLHDSDNARKSRKRTEFILEKKCCMSLIIMTASIPGRPSLQSVLSSAGSHPLRLVQGTTPATFQA